MSGNISSIIDNLVLTPVAPLTKSDIIHLSGDYYATVLKQLSTASEHMYTFTIDADGNTSDLIDNWTYSLTGRGYAPVSLKVPGTDYVVVGNSDASWDGYLETITVDGTGNISKTVVDSTKIFEYSECPHMCEQYTSGDKVYYTVMTSGECTGSPTNHAAMMLTSINTLDGSIINEHGIEADTACYMPQVIKIADNVVAGYYKANNVARLKTFAIDTLTHTIGSQIDTLDVASDGPFAGGPDMHLAFCHLVDNMYVFMHTNSSGIGHISTVTIDGSGNINEVLDTYTHGGPTVTMTDINRVSDDMIALMYDDGSQISIDTYEIDVDGMINNVRLSTRQVYSGADGSYFCKLDFILNSYDKWTALYASPNGATFNTYAIAGTAIDAVGEVLTVKNITFDELQIKYRIT